MEFFSFACVPFHIILESDLEELERISSTEDHPLHSTLLTPACIEMLCEKYDIPATQDYKTFSLKARKKYFFTRYSDEYRRENYSVFSSLQSCIKVACRHDDFEFVKFLFTVEQLFDSSHHLMTLARQCCADFSKFEMITGNTDSVYSELALSESIERNLSDEVIRSYFELGYVDYPECYIIQKLIGRARWTLFDIISMYDEPEEPIDVFESIVSEGNIELLQSRDVPQCVLDLFSGGMFPESNKQEAIWIAYVHDNPNILDYFGVTVEEMEYLYEVENIFFWYIENGGKIDRLEKIYKRSISMKTEKWMYKNLQIKPDCVKIPASMCCEIDTVKYYKFISSIPELKISNQFLEFISIGNAELQRLIK